MSNEKVGDSKGKEKEVKKATIIELTNTKQLEHNILTLRKERAWRLKQMNSIYKKIIRDPHQCTAIKFFPFTESLHIGGDCQMVPFELELAEICQKHNIILISDNKAHKKLKNDYNNVLLYSDHSDNSFCQDFLDFNAEELCFPAMDDSSSPIYTQLEKAVQTARNNRFAPYKELDVNSPIINQLVGDAFRIGYSKVFISLANSLNVPAVMNLTCSEGGNMLLGFFEKMEPYAIIGLDSYYMTKELIELELNRELSENEIKTAFSIDTGIKRENLFFIEQPGGWHLDMNMAILDSNTIVINDSNQSFEILEKVLDKITDEDFEKLIPYRIFSVGESKPPSLIEQKYINKKFSNQDGIDQELVTNYKTEMIKEILNESKKRLEIKSKFEQEAVEQLKKFEKFNVIQFPGRFEMYLPEIPEAFSLMNFFNMLTVTTPQKERLIITMGCPEEKINNISFKELFFDMIKPIKDIKDENVIFLDYENSQKSLYTQGGISCRVKTLASLSHKRVQEE